MPRKENTKARSWERDRRERMNMYFKTLADLLPPHEDGRIRNKVDILTHTAEYIKNLHGRGNDLFHVHIPDIHKEELLHLRKLVSQLYSRTQLLSALLKEAGIPVPAEPSLEKVTTLKWSTKISADDGERFFMKFEERKRSKSKKKEKVARNKVPSKRKPVSRSQNQIKKQVNDNASKNLNKIENQENRVNSPDVDSESSNDDDSSTTTGISSNIPYASISTSSVEVKAAVPGRMVNLESEKHDSPKKVKRKSRAKQKYKMPTRINHAMANLGSGTLILSGAKLMPVVTPMAPLTPNIIVNAQAQSGSPIILSNGQQNQMIVMQHLTNPGQNSIIPVCNQTLINAVQKVTLNPMSAIQANMVVSSQDWVSNVKSIINATKISGRKSILPKGKEVTKTTTSYKVPIPAVHKEKADKSKDVPGKRETEMKTKVKTAIKNGKSLGKTEPVDEAKFETKQVANGCESAPITLKRTPSSETSDVEDPKNKKFKSQDWPSARKNVDTSKNVPDDQHETNKIVRLDSQDLDNEKIDRATSTAADKNLAEQNSTTSIETNSSGTTVEEKSKKQTTFDKKSSNDDSISTTEGISRTVCTTSSSATQTDQNDLIVTESGESSTNPTSSATTDELSNSVCNLGTRFDSLLQANVKRPEIVENVTPLDNSKIILNLDTNTTTTVKPENNVLSKSINPTLLAEEDTLRVNKMSSFAKDEGLKTLSYSTDNSFVPINRTEALHSDLSNDIFASLQVPSSSHHPESISPTAAFLMAFPLVSSLNGKTEVLEDDLKDDFKYHSQTPPMLLQIGAMEPNSFKPKASSTEKHQADCGRKNVEVSDEKASSAMCKESLATLKNSEPRPEAKTASNTTNLIPAVQRKVNLQDDNALRSNRPNTAKSMPKIVNNQSIKEHYKIVQTSIPPSLTTPIEINNSFTRTSIAPTSYSATPTVGTCSSSANTHTTDIRDTTKGTPNITAFTTSTCQPITCSSSNPPPAANTNFQIFDESRTSRYTSQHNFMPSYPSSTNLELPHYTPPTFTSSAPKIPEHPAATQPPMTQCHPSQKMTTLHLEQTYSTQAKVSRTIPATDPNLPSISKHQENQHDTSYNVKKQDSFSHNFPFNKPNVVSSQNQLIQTNSNATMFQPKQSNVQSYMPYNTDAKKMIGGKPLIANSVQYSQDSMIPSSNFEQSSIADNSVKSTTTVAHNTSNFSILSWTTFSPAGTNNANNMSIGNSNTNNNANNINNHNNIMHYEHVPTLAQTLPEPENKTVCENFGYMPVQKENNVGFANMLPEFSNDTGLGVNKARAKSMADTQKQQIFLDQSKPHIIQTNVETQKQNQNSSIDYKFTGENKSKGKYSIENSFVQTNYANMEQPSKQQGLSNNGKQEKANYAMPNYNPQVSFNPGDSHSQVKYPAENYPGTSFKYNDKAQAIPKFQTNVQSHHSVPEQSNPTYKQGNKAAKAQQIGAPVNWMMTPEIKHNTNISDIILPPIGKELEYCQNNLFAQNTTYNQSSANQFYNNYEVAHSFPNLSTVQNELKKVDPFYSDDQPFSWSPTKNTHGGVDQSQAIKTIDQHVVPSTLPTLVGDLALGTNIPDKQNFLFGQMPAARIPTDQKDLVKDKDANANRDFHAILNPQNAQHVPGSFLSVSQLVEHEKAEKSHQGRKPQRKSTSPRGKRQMEVRKQGSAEQHHHEEPKGTDQNFNEQSYQQKYQQQQQQQQQNDVNWRNRNCKSNYTAEALIGSNTNVQETNHQGKHSAIKFSHNYPQNNKFSGALTGDTAIPIHYFPNSEDPNNYGQTNQNFNSYSYPTNPNIYPTTNFITSIANTPTTNFITSISNTSTTNFITSISNTATTYMMPSHDNADYLEQNTFLLPNSNPVAKTQHYGGKPQNCEKRSYSAAAKRSKRKTDMTQNIEFPISGNVPIEDYHSNFLPHTNLYQNTPQSNVYPKSMNNSTMPINQNTLGGSTGSPMNPNGTRSVASNSPMVMTHPSGTTLTNFNLSTIFPEINDKVVGYKPPNSMPAGLTQPTTHIANYAQRTNYSNSLVHPPQVSEAAQFSNAMAPSSSVHYKNS